MKPESTAVILIGYQNDYFSPDGILHSVVEESSRITGTLENTVALLERLAPTPALLIATPIIFTPDYSELEEPVGILKTIKEVGAFKAGNKGAETIEELRRFGERILEVPGKRGLNAFSNTDLDTVLRKHGVSDVVLAGTVTSICIDSGGRAAHERGYHVSVLSDCISGRSNFEQDFYCEQIFPLYADVITSRECLALFGLEKAAPAERTAFAARAS
jgi:nicotinamidase-related amidase